ncbi:hypothetical protein SBF1_6810002 [Candidatus Desulfosporosinus infrequens]|uniref:Uncharacterized protein n=1 Tax=Candidatus Desulfosporosinus infrequens TaxID=2043169 RepID=A0A2U3LNQ9_9FIRM|nr:hypothetical protein SBF1_6810002 [Candidatus Desulfosporosinus infrequens]
MLYRSERSKVVNTLKPIDFFHNQTIQFGLIIIISIQKNNISAKHRFPLFRDLI